VIPKGVAGLAFPSRVVTEQIRATVERALKNTLAFP
jgi:hypothetical protein